MDQDRWKTVNLIFHAALEVSSSERHSFVLTASNGDPDLQAEVEVLLQADREVILRHHFWPQRSYPIPRPH